MILLLLLLLFTGLQQQEEWLEVIQGGRWHRGVKQSDTRQSDSSLESHHSHSHLSGISSQEDLRRKVLLCCHTTHLSLTHLYRLGICGMRTSRDGKSCHLTTRQRCLDTSPTRCTGRILRGSTASSGQLINHIHTSILCVIVPLRSWHLDTLSGSVVIHSMSIRERRAQDWCEVPSIQGDLLNETFIIQKVSPVLCRLVLFSQNDTR